ncbi:MAG: transglutaminase-like cysteine peptidase [Gammaproteobacteria bacterium]|nr:transglutaminase-like cysteine peptidase [Gammaproteobacteria bacterium]
MIAIPSRNLLQRWVAPWLLILSLINLADADLFPLNRKQSMVIEHQYGAAALQRIANWQNLMQTQAQLDDREKLELVNRFFNQRRFISDDQNWNHADYWATPLEFLAKDAGDCEDYSIAKFFTLKAMGVDENKLRITYVKAKELNQAHMVLTYTDKAGEVPLVLDNLIGKIKPASQREDLRPIYSFNGDGLWLARERGQGKKGRENRLARWSDLLDRMHN